MVLNLVNKKTSMSVSAIQWTGNNLKNVILFTGKYYRFDEWFKSFQEYEEYVKKDNNIIKLFDTDFKTQRVQKVFVGEFIVKDEFGNNIKYTEEELKLNFTDSNLERIDNFSTSNETVFVEPHKGFIELTLCPVAEPEESVSVSYSCSSEDIGKLIAALQRAKDKFDNA